MQGVAQATNLWEGNVVETLRRWCGKKIKCNFVMNKEKMYLPEGKNIDTRSAFPRRGEVCAEVTKLK